MGAEHGRRCLIACLPLALAALIVLPLPRPASAQPDAGQNEATDTPAAAPRPPQSVMASDHGWTPGLSGDAGQQADVTFELSPDDQLEDRHSEVVRYVIQKAGEPDGPYTDAVAAVVPEEQDYEDRRVRVVVGDLVRGEPYYFRVKAVGPDGRESEPVAAPEPAIPRRELFDSGRFWLAVMLLAICGSVVLYIALARRGIDLKVRKIAGLEAVDEAVGRATEMGRSILFIPGIQDMNDIQTIAGITILARVARVAAEYDAKVEVPTMRSLVMTTARETVQSSFVQAGRPDAYHEDHIYYVTDEQFGYVAYLSGMMVREKPAACFYMGSFFAESLILAETGNSIGAIQVAGTAQPAQLPFFVAACDYTLIGEEFFAASAYLSGEPDQLGSLKGQDVGKLIVGVLLVIGCVLSTLAIEALTGPALSYRFEAAAEFLRDVMLQSG